MYGIDWTAPIPAPGRTRKNKTRKMKKGKLVKPKKVRAAGSELGSNWAANTQRGKKGGRKKGDAVNSPESRARAGKSVSENSWRRRAKDTGGQLQSGSGSAGESDFSVYRSGRVRPHFNKWDRGWNE